MQNEIVNPEHVVKIGEAFDNLYNILEEGLLTTNEFHHLVGRLGTHARQYNIEIFKLRGEEYGMRRYANKR